MSAKATKSPRARKRPRGAPTYVRQVVDEREVDLLDAKEASVAPFARDDVCGDPAQSTSRLRGPRCGTMHHLHAVARRKARLSMGRTPGDRAARAKTSTTGRPSGSCFQTTSTGVPTAQALAA